MKIKDLLELIVQAIVDNPDQVRIYELEGDQVSVLELRVAKADIGKVIGKKGKNVNAIRTILSAASVKTRKHVSLEIVNQ